MVYIWMTWYRTSIPRPGVNPNNIIKEMGAKYDLIETLGSDYHGKTKPSIHLGQSEGHSDEGEMYRAIKSEINKARNQYPQS